MLRLLGSLRRQWDDAVAAFAAVFRNRNLRRVQLAAVGATIGDWGYMLAVSVFAFREGGGAQAVGLLLLVRMLPAGLISPFAAVLADRFPRERVMVAVDLARVPLILAAAISAYSNGPHIVVYAVAVATSIIGTPFKPAEAALIGSLAKTPSELTAANVSFGTIESLGAFAGPAIAGVLLAVVSPGTVFVFTAVLALWSAACIAGVKVPVEAEAALDEAPAEEAAAGVLHEVGAGFRALAEDGRLAILSTLFAAQWLVSGIYYVVIVVIAIDLLGLGNGGVGYLDSACGVGALVGVLGAGTTLVGVRRLSVPFIVGSLLWSIPFILIGAYVNTAFALLMFAVLGVGSVLATVSGYTLTQRAVDNEVLGRAFGVYQTLGYVVTGVGAAITSPLIDWLGTRGALVATGCVVPALTIAFGPKLLQIDLEATAPAARRLGLLRGSDIFAPLPGIAIESLASQLVEQSYPAGTEIIREGDIGDRFYLIALGKVEVSTQGKLAATLGEGDYIGEIALLRDVPRTATCTAASDVEAFSLEREPFLEAVTGHAGSKETADRVIGARLSGLSTATGAPTAFPARP
jgi:MFS family permease